MDRNILQKLKDAIAKSNNIGIAVGSQPSVDEMGAALSLYLLLQNANKKVSVASPSDPIVEISSLVGINKVQKQFGGNAGDLVVSFPYQEGEIEKVSYTLENNHLNIIVKAAAQGLSFNEKDVQYTRGSGTIDLLITIGVANLSDVNPIIDEQKLSNVQIINIDNDSTNQGYGDIVLVEPKASSVSEYLSDIVLTLGFTVEQDVAQNLLSGVMSATKNFQDPRTTTLAFEVAAYLMKNGARRIISRESSEQPQEQSQSRPLPQPQMQEADVVDDAQAEQSSQAPQPQNTQEEQKPPLDWLTPKVYKGSSDV